MNTMIDITETELEQIAGGDKGAVCAFAIGLAIGLLFVNPLWGGLTAEMVTVPACAADLAS